MILEAIHTYCITDNSLLVVGTDPSVVEVFVEVIGCHFQDYGDLSHLIYPSIPVFRVFFGN